MHEAQADPAAYSANVSDADRAAAASRADRGAGREVTLLADQSSVDLWMLPLNNYTVSAPFSADSARLHPGVDLTAKGGTAYYAAHAGTVKLARAYGGYGYAVLLDLGDGTTVLYGHSSKLFVHEGQQVLAGEVLGLVGDSGYAFGDGLYFEVRVHNKAIDPGAFLAQKGVDINAGGQASEG